MDTEHYRPVERELELPYWNNCANCGQPGTKPGESDAGHSTTFERPDRSVGEFEVITSLEIGK